MNIFLQKKNKFKEKGRNVFGRNIIGIIVKSVKLHVKWSHLAENDVSRGQIGSKFGQIGEKFDVGVGVDRRAVGDGRRTGGLRHGPGGADQNSRQVQSSA